jgi:hypothetical protein
MLPITPTINVIGAIIIDIIKKLTCNASNKYLRFSKVIAKA